MISRNVRCVAKGRRRVSITAVEGLKKENVVQIRELSLARDERVSGVPASDRPSVDRVYKICMIYKINLFWALREVSVLVSIRAHGFCRESPHYGWPAHQQGVGASFFRSSRRKS